MKMRFLPDTPIRSQADDSLQFSPFIELIADSLTTTEPPFVYGVLGDWGTGKTSILRLLQAQCKANLDDQLTFIPIWFNAWKYENEANILYPLLHAIKTQYEHDLKDQASQNFQQSFGQIVATSALALGDVGLRVATKQLGGEAVSLNDLQGFLQTVREHPDQLEAIFGGWANEVNKLDNAFRDLLAAYAEDVARKLSTDPKRVRFVILIDDLDRCLPETTIAVLEGIKNFLAAEPALDPVEAEPNPSIFILALNPTVVYQGIQAKYKGSEVDGREYLEKILNYSFYVPEPELDRVKRFATGRLQELLPEEADQRRLKRHLETFGTVLEVCRFNNPRKIKRILNRYLLFLSRAEQTGDLAKMMPQNVARLLVLAEYYPALFNLFYGSQDPNHLGEHLGNMANAGAIKDYYGVELPASYPPLFKLKELFDLQKSGDNLERELKAVFELTRLV